MAMYLRKISCWSKKVHRQPSWMEASIWPWLRINPRRCEALCELDEVTREKLSNTWQRSDRTSVGRVCDRHEVKPNRKFDSVRGLVDRSFRRARPRFSIQFSISSAVIVRNRRIEPKFGLLNLSIIRGLICSIVQKTCPNIASFDLLVLKYGVNGKTVTCLPSGSSFWRAFRPTNPGNLLSQNRLWTIGRISEKNSFVTRLVLAHRPVLAHFHPCRPTFCSILL